MPSQLRVLIVEDYDSMRALVQRYLKRSGYGEVRAVRCPLDALPLIHRERFDLIISDYEMPGMNGLELLAEIRADPKTKSTKFIMLTCSDDRELVRQAMALGVDAYHTKPIAQKTLENSVKRFDRPAPRLSKRRTRGDARPAFSKIAPVQFGRAPEMQMVVL